MELEGEVKKYFKDLLECPICFETIDSVPIYQCQNGHVVCKNCHPKLKTCPICRVDIIKKSKRDGLIRNLKLEEMVERLQSSVSEATKKLVSESIQIDPIVPTTANVHRDTNQEARQDPIVPTTASDTASWWTAYYNPITTSGADYRDTNQEARQGPIVPTTASDAASWWAAQSGE